MLVWTVTGFGEGSCKASAWLTRSNGGVQLQYPLLTQYQLASNEYYEAVWEGGR